MPTHDLDYPAIPVPGNGAVTPIADGVLWIRMPLPFALNHVNLWLLDDGDGWTLVDTGFPTDQIKSLWQSLLDDGIIDRPITRLLVTHFHPDHIGMAGWLTERLGQRQASAPDLAISRTEWLLGRMLSLDTSAETDAQIAQFYREAGLEGPALEGLIGRGNGYARSVTPIPRRFTQLAGGQDVTIGGRYWRVIVGSGHSPEHVSLFCENERVLIAGDQILPRISPNISVGWAAPTSDPLGEYLASFGQFEALPDDVLILPSHGEPFYGLHQRIAALRQHHHERLEETLESAATPITTATTTRLLFKRELDTHQLFFAVGEALSHLNTLVGQGRLTRSTDETGVVWYQRR